MALRFASLGSGSKGNGTLVEGGDSCLLLDCGFSGRETERRLARLDRSGHDLTAIVVTHEHSDHVGGVLPLARKYRLPVYMTAGTASRAVPRGYERLHLVKPQQGFTLGALQLTPIAVPHDAREPVQYVFEHGGHRLGVLTDLGSLTPSVVSGFSGCDGLLLEANHDSDLLRLGPYPPQLKRRVGGNLGHLNNHQAASLLCQLEKRKIQTLVLGHISLKNNSLTHVATAVAPHLEGVGNVMYACQEQGFPWQVIE